MILPVWAMIAVAILTTLSCHDAFNKCLSGSGKAATERREMYPFRNIEVRDNIDLTIRQSDHYSVEIRAGEKLIPMICTNIENDLLLISNESICPLLKDPWEPVAVEVQMPDLDSLVIRSQKTVKTDGTFTSEKLSVRITGCPAHVFLTVDAGLLHVTNADGTADVTVEGISGTAYIYNGGYGPVDCRGLWSQNLYAHSNSPNHLKVRAGSKLLNAVINFSGNIYYTGNPARIEYFPKGSGRLIRED